jgi:hypothetical protein
LGRVQILDPCLVPYPHLVPRARVWISTVVYEIGEKKKENILLILILQVMYFRRKKKPNPHRRR